MGTRSVTVIKKNKKNKVVQYCQWDGYPEGMGFGILNELRNININDFKDKIDNVYFGTQKDFDKLGENWKETNPQLSRDCGSEIISQIMSGKTLLGDSSDCLPEGKDNFCIEYYYLIDFDENIFSLGLDKDTRLEFPLNKLPTNDFFLEVASTELTLEEFLKQRKIVEEMSRGLNENIIS